jgi:hypothetical protein
MIPPFEDNGYLPPGIHRAVLDEIETRFAHESELRRVQMESLRWLVDLAKLIQGLPFLDIDLVRQDGWDRLVETVFATDRHDNPKGMIEVVSWT